MQYLILCEKIKILPVGRYFASTSVKDCLISFSGKGNLTASFANIARSF
jgi:hypothetical protein